MDARKIEFSTLIGYVEHETERWRTWFQAAPAEVMDLPLGPGADGTIRSLVKHIFAVELRYAQRLAGEPVSDYEQLADGTVEQLWQIHHTAMSVLGRYLAEADDDAVDQVLVSETRRLGRLEARAHTVVVHSLVHGIRHWAQIAMVLRQHGHGGLWEHDWLMSPAVR